MLRFFKNIFSSTNNNSMESTEDYDVLDLLGFYCSELVEKLEETNGNEEIQENLIRNYIEKADKQHKSIPDFKEDLDWFNVTEPLSISQSLKGKIVVLDFFTYCCINCMHILPDLKRIETLYSIEDGLIVIGVHSPKFDNEKDSSNILSAIQRYNITHPVVNDNQSTMWMDLKIRCWPTLLVLGPHGNPLFIIMGEGQCDLLEKYIRVALKYYRDEKNEIASYSLSTIASRDLVMTAHLRFPGKIACSKISSSSNVENNDADTDTAAELYAISDSGNHRILIINSCGDVLQKIGGGGVKSVAGAGDSGDDGGDGNQSPTIASTSGFVDGDFETARFNTPQGVAFLNEHCLFVADTENHAIRKIDLKTRQVETVCGTGKQGHDRIGGGGGGGGTSDGVDDEKLTGKQQEISSPWDLICYRTRDMDISFHMDENSVPEKDVVLIAMAGTHQIWALYLDDVIWWKYKKCAAMSCAAIVGNGREENRNNTYPQNASFAQPSGLAIDKKTKTLYIADSESSCIRKCLLEDGKVLPVAGGDRNPLNLFAYGDVDGKPSVAKFQHPLGVAFSSIENAVYVADTYNHKIKKIDGVTHETTTCKIRDANAEAGGMTLMQFNEPGGLCLNPSGEYLYIADTNNHNIEKVNLKTMTAKTLKLNFNCSSSSRTLKGAATSKRKADYRLQLSAIKIKPNSGGKIKLSITLNCENDVKLSTDAPQQWNVYLPNEHYFIDRQNGNIRNDGKIDIDITVPQNDDGNEDIINIFNKLNLCSKGACYSKIYSIDIPLIFDKNGLDCIIEDVNAFVTENSIRI